MGWPLQHYLLFMIRSGERLVGRGQGKGGRASLELWVIVVAMAAPNWYGYGQSSQDPWTEDIGFHSLHCTL